MNNEDLIKDYPFADLLGLKCKEKLTDTQQLGKRLLELVKQHKSNNQ